MAYIQSQPRWPLLWYGNGDWCECRHYEEKKHRDSGIEGYEFIINPSWEVKQKYKLERGKEIDYNTVFVRMWYPKTNVFILSRDPVLGRILVTTTFEGRQTQLSLANIEFTEQIEHLQKENKILRATNAALNINLYKSNTQQRRHVKENVEMIKEARKAGGTTGGGLDGLQQTDISSESGMQ